MEGLDPNQRERITETVLIVEFALIVFLVWGVSLEFRANQYLQTWVNEKAPFLGYLLNGYLAAILAGVLVGSIVLFAQNRPGKGKRASPNNA